MPHKSEHWRNPQTGYVECQCCEKWALDVEDLGNQVSELKRTVKRLMRPVLEEECPRPINWEERALNAERALLIKAKRDRLPVDVITPERRVQRWLEDARESRKPVDAEEAEE